MIRFIRIGKTEWDIESHIGYADKNLRKRFTALVKIINNQSNLLGSLQSGAISPLSRPSSLVSTSSCVKHVVPDLRDGNKTIK